MRTYFTKLPQGNKFSNSEAREQVILHILIRACIFNWYYPLKHVRNFANKLQTSGHWRFQELMVKLHRPPEASNLAVFQSNVFTQTNVRLCVYYLCGATYVLSRD